MLICHMSTYFYTYLHIGYTSLDLTVYNFRSGVNNALIGGDKEMFDHIQTNWINRQIDNDRTAKNIKSWKENDLAQRSLNAKELKDMLRNSSAASLEECSLWKHNKANLLSGGSVSLPKLLNPLTSTKVEIPVDITDRIKYSKKLV
jgi:hypothetical protein